MDYAFPVESPSGRRSSSFSLRDCRLWLRRRCTVLIETPSTSATSGWVRPWIRTSSNTSRSSSGNWSIAFSIRETPDSPPTSCPLILPRRRHRAAPRRLAVYLSRRATPFSSQAAYAGWPRQRIRARSLAGLLEEPLRGVPPPPQAIHPPEDSAVASQAADNSDTAYYGTVFRAGCRSIQKCPDDRFCRGVAGQFIQISLYRDSCALFVHG